MATNFPPVRKGDVVQLWNGWRREVMGIMTRPVSGCAAEELVISVKTPSGLSVPTTDDAITHIYRNGALVWGREQQAVQLSLFTDAQMGETT